MFKMVLTKLLLFFCISLTVCEDRAYYEMLGVSQDADNKEIRKAFKKLALNLHPDKNPDDPDAQAKFIKLTRAYEVLKDPSLRKTYDMYGEEKVTTKQNGHYHSYSYYTEHFGIYDDDPEIITLNRFQFESNVLDPSGKQWFVNFYSPLCSHCHELAPTWRELAKELFGVVMFGAVNCEDEWALCRQQNIRGYPSLVLYPKGIKFSAKRTKEALSQFIMNNIDISFTHINSPSDWDLLMHDKSHRSWILMLCQSNDLPSCPTGDFRVKIAAVLSGLVGSAIVNCHSLSSCSSMTDSIKSSIVYWQKAPNGNSWSARSIRSSYYNPQDILKEVLDYFPELIQFDTDSFKEMINKLETDPNGIPCLVYFYIGGTTEFDLEIKKLPIMIPDFVVGKISCAHRPEICQQVVISRYPSFAVFKKGGGYEFYHGETTVSSIANFAKESAAATNLRTLSNKEFPTLVMGEDGGSNAWFIDFYAPWCAPCLRFLPEFRKASKMFDDSLIRFGTVDCTVFSELCSQHNIRAYPTTVLYNLTRPVREFRGKHLASSISDFLLEFLNPQLQELDTEMFVKLVENKKPDTYWFILFSVPDRQHLNGEMKKLAQSVAVFPNVFIGEVNCLSEQVVCSGLKFYPTLRLYPAGSAGISTYIEYSAMRYDSLSLKRWLFTYLQEYVEDLTADKFSEHVMRNYDHDWLVNFYSPFCGHCHVFEPEFITVAFKMKDKIKSGKVNCQQHYSLCHQAGIRAYPTVMFYKSHSKTRQGQEITSHSVNSIIEFINDMLSTKPAHTVSSSESVHDEL